MPRRLLSYFIYIILTIFILYFGTSTITNLKNLTSTAYNPYPSMLFNIFFAISVGLFLGLPELFNRYKNIGKWKINWMRIFIIGLPTIIISFSHILYFSFIGKYIYKILMPWVFENYAVIISGIIFGYNLISSIIKVND